MQTGWVDRLIARVLFALFAVMGPVLPFSVVCADSSLLELRDISTVSTRIVLVVPPHGVVRLFLNLGSEFEAKPMEVSLTDFAGEKGDPISVVFVTRKADARDADTSEVGGRLKHISKGHHGHVILQLDASHIARPGSYFGELLVWEQGIVRKAFLVELKRAGPRIRGADGSGVASVNFPFDGLGSIMVDASSLGKTSADVSLSQFVGPRGDSQPITFSPKDGRTEGSDRLENLELEGSLSLLLDASRLSPGETYTGQLIIRIDGSPLEPLRLALTRTRPTQDAILLLDRTEWQQELTNCWFSCQPDRVEIVLSEKSHQLPIEGVSITAPSTSSPNGRFNPVSDLRITFNNGQSTTTAPQLDLWRLDPSDRANLKQRSIPTGGQGVLQISFPELEPGEYKTKLRILAKNAKPDALPEANLTVRVKFTPVYPLLVLLGSVLLSYAATKGLQTQRRRIELKQEIDRIKRSLWLRRDKSGMLPIVQAAAVLTRIRTAIDHEKGLFRWLSVPNALETQLTSVKTLSPLLERISALEYRWEHSNEDQMVVNRARKILGKMVRKLGTAPLDTTLVGALSSELADLEKWDDRSELEARYWVDLKADILQLKDKVHLHELEAADVTAVHDTLQRMIQELDLPSTQQEAVQLAQNAKSKLDGVSEADRETIGSNLDSVISQLRTLDLSWALQVRDHLRKAENLVRVVDQQGVNKTENELDAAVSCLADVSAINLDEVRKLLDDATKVLSRTVGPDSKAGAVLERLGEILDHIEKVKPAEYRAKIQTAKQHLEAVRNSAQQLIRSLLAGLDPGTTPKSLPAAISLEVTYATLKVLWEQHGRNPQRFDELIKMHRQEQDLNALFDEADDWAWKDLKDKAEDIKIERPGSAQTPPKAYELIEFAVVVRPKSLGNNYLFKHGLIYEWKIRYGEKEGEVLKPRTREPRVTQFIPVPVAEKDVKVSVVIRFDRISDTIPIKPAPSFSVSPSNEFNFTRAFQRVELGALVIVVLVAVVSGMESDFFDQALSPGSWRSYMGLAVWGLGADQLKNLLQRISTYTGATVTP